ncbi:hypothetical protein F5883DRAFT_537926 [Diaporthe sp. PMI_573]|nr:hypothetical protein F5883DRAFT_537926 [Diaporthaceae sp. PMI_573]
MTTTSSGFGESHAKGILYLLARLWSALARGTGNSSTAMSGLFTCCSSSGMSAHLLLDSDFSGFFHGHKLSQEFSRRRRFQRFHMCQTANGSRDDITLSFTSRHVLLQSMCSSKRRYPRCHGPDASLVARYSSLGF